MPKLTYKKSSFNSGELSPRLYSRVAVGKYPNGLETATNGFAIAHGPFHRRNGTKYIAETKDNNAARLLKFQFSESDAFILEFTDSFIRFYKNGAQVTESDITITGITAADPGVVTATAHGLSNGDHVYITGVLGMTEVNDSNRPYEVANKTANTFELNTIEAANVDTSAYTAYSSAGTINKIYEIASPYGSSDIDNISYVQYGDILYLAHPDYEPRKITRTGDTDWKIETIEFAPPATYESGYAPTTSLKPLATTGTDKSIVAGAVDLTDGSTYKWTASGSGTNEYYVDLFAGGDPSISTPNVVVENLSIMTEGTVGSLAAGEYDYGDNDSLGYSTIYVRLTDGADPDSKASEYVVYSETDVFLEADIGRQILNETADEAGVASITDVTNASVVVTDILTDFTDTNIITSTNWKMDLSPIGKLQASGTSAGSIVTVKATYSTGARGDKVAVTGITVGNTAKVTATAHGFTNGMIVAINDVVGMEQVNETTGRRYNVRGKTANDFFIGDEDTGVYLNSNNFGPYVSGGVVQRVLDDVAQDTFRSDDVDKYILMNDGVLKITEFTSATEVQCEVLKSLTSADETDNWTIETEDWTASRGYPRAVGLFSERLVFGGTSQNPQTLWFSETGIFEGMGVGSLDTDAIIVDLSSRQVNRINWIANSRDLVIGTEGSEVTINAPSATSGLSSSNIQQIPRTYHGSSAQIPIEIGAEIIFLQASGRKVRTFRYDFNIDGYLGEDLHFLSEHITEDGIKEIAYAQEPDNIIYSVTDTGDMLAGVYKRDQEVIGWSKFTTTGTYENVQTIANNSISEVWVVVNRTVNGSTKRYVELLDNGTGEDRLDGFSDSYLTYSSPTTITAITEADPAVVTSTAHGLSDGDRVKLIDVGGMTEVNNTTYIVANKTANTFELTDLQSNNVDSSAYTTYTSGGEVHKLVQTVSGLDHLEGESVEIKADGAAHPVKTVSSGSITLDRWSYEVTAGLAYTTTCKTLTLNYDIGRGDMQGQKSRFVRPILRVDRSTIPTVEGWDLPSRDSSMEMDQAVDLYTGDLKYSSSDWSNDLQLTITADGPFPLRLGGIFGTIEGNIP